MTFPAAPKRFDELHGSNQSLACEPCARTFGLQTVAACVHDLEITDNAGAIAVRREIDGASTVVQRTLLSISLVHKITNGC